MDTRLYQLRTQLWLTPRQNIEPPEIVVKLTDEVIYTGPLVEPRCFAIDRFLPASIQSLSVEFVNKKDSDTDTITGTDKAIIIDRAVFNDIESPKFVWAGTYYPKYPEPWASEQTSLGVVLEFGLKSQNYLGWNGLWKLEFSIPIFTWIHGLEDLGWIYN